MSARRRVDHATLTDEEIRQRARDASGVRAPALVDDTTIIGAGVDAWLWGVVYEDGSDGFLVWGEKHQLDVTPRGMRADNGKRIERAVVVDLVHQVRVRLPEGAVARRLVSTGLASHMLAAGQRGTA